MTREVFISRFSPSRTDPEDLEAITVQREALVAETVDCVRESVLTENKHHVLLVGPRGAGKTHAITLVRYRLSKMDDLADRLRVAWLNEDETSDSFLSLLLRVHRALAAEYPTEFPTDSSECVFDLDNRDTAAEALSRLVSEQLGTRVLLVLVENLDSLFRDMGEAELKRWRAYVQNHPQFCTVASAQRLFHGVSDRDAPFFGFFRVEHLKPFRVGDAGELLEKIARLKEDSELARFIASPHGRARIRALHHLTGGNQRLFIILSDFINRDSLDSLAGPFEELVDEQLTPYYQERLRWLPPQQRRIVEFLCAATKPVLVTSIARHLFINQSAASAQLKTLREIGYVVSHKRGRESLCELAEPLMLLSHQVKETRGHVPLRLLVDFLRVWYDHGELARRMASVGNTDASIADYSAVAGMKEAPQDQLAIALSNRGLVRCWREDVEGASADFSKVVKMDNAPNETKSRALFNWAWVTMRQVEWTDAFRQLRLAFRALGEEQPGYLGYIPGFIAAILDAGQTPAAWTPKLDQLLEIYFENGVLTELASGLVQSIPSLGETTLSPAGLNAWHAVWAERTDKYPEFALPVRLLRTGIDFFVSERDEAVLLNLPDEERRILSQALGLEKREADVDG